MTDEQWTALVERLEAQAREGPKAHARRVAAFAVLGYAAIAAAVLLLLAAVGAVLYAATVTSGR